MGCAWRGLPSVTYATATATDDLDEHLGWHAQDLDQSAFTGVPRFEDAPSIVEDEGPIVWVVSAISRIGRCACWQHQQQYEH